MFFSHFRRVAHAIDRAGGNVNEPFDACFFARLYHRLEAFVIDRSAERGVKIETRVVRNTRHVDDIVATFHYGAIFCRVTNISGDNLQIRVAWEAHGPEEHQIIDHDGVPRLEEFGDQDATLVARATGNENSFHKRGNESPSLFLSSHFLKGMKLGPIPAFQNPLMKILYRASKIPIEYSRLLVSVYLCSKEKSRSATQSAVGSRLFEKTCNCTF